MLKWINARHAGSCWYCNADVIRGDKVGLIPCAKRPWAGGNIVCRACANTFAARMAEKEESRRDAYAVAARTPADT